MVFLSLGIILVSCESPSDNTIEGFTENELQIQSFSVSPDTLELISNENENIESLINIHARFSSPERIEFPLYAYVQDVVSSEIYGTFTIPARHLTAFDLNYETTLTLPEAGFLELSVVLQVPIVNGQQLRAEKKLLALSGENAPPQILDIAYPDTAQIPANGQNAIGFFAQADDPQGITDIQGVFMDIYVKTTKELNGQLVLLDNGDLANGDQTARDGIFTAVVGLTPTTPARTLVLHFYALDRQGLSSDTTVTEFTLIR